MCKEWGVRCFYYPVDVGLIAVVHIFYNLFAGYKPFPFMTLLLWNFPAISSAQDLLKERKNKKTVTCNI